MKKCSRAFTGDGGPGFVLGAVLLVSCLPGLAQTTGNIGGKVVDTANGPLPGATMEARSPALQGSRRTTSDAAGNFHFPLLPPGTYVVSARLGGFKDAQQLGVRVDLGGAARVPMTLVLAAAAAVEVSGEVPLIDTSSTRIGVSMNANVISRLPLGRNYASVTTTVAGTGQDAVGFTIYGATGLENQYLIDGINTTGVRFGNQGKSLNAEFIQEVEVRTGGYEAEFGQVIGGNINVVTKSGGNEFHGGVFGYYDGAALASSSKHTDELAALNQTLPNPPRRVDAGIDLGGYFLKDRLWFFGAFDRVLSDEDYSRVESLTFPASGPPTSNYKSGTDGSRTNLFSGKVTFLAGPSHTLNVSVFGDPGTYTGRRNYTDQPLYLSSDPGPDSATLVNRESGGTDVSAKWDGLFGPHFAVQLQYGHHAEKTGVTSDYPDALSILQYRGQFTQYLPGSSPARLEDDTYRRNMYKGTGSAFLSDHEIRAGFFYEKLNSSRSVRFGGGESIAQYLDDSGAFEYASHGYYAAVPLNCTMRQDGSNGNFGFVDPTTCKAWQKSAVASTNPKTSNLAAFAQDSWRVAGNLTINAGIRYEEQRLYGATGDVAINLKGEWSPRFGAVWDPLRNGRSKVFASYGRYYQTIPQDIQVRALGNENIVFAYNYTPDRSDTVGYPFPYVSVGDYVPPGLKGMYQDEVIAGAEFEFARNWSIGLKGIYRALGRVLEDRCDLTDPRVDIGGLVPPGTIATCAVVNVGEGDLGRILDPTNPDCFSDHPKNTQPAPCESVRARRYFRGLQLDLNHRFADRYYLHASYLYSKLEGNYDGLVNQTTGLTLPGENLDFDYIDVVPNISGRLSLDRRHQFKLSGSYAFPFGLQIGINSFVSSGAPLSLLGYARPGYPVQRFLVPRGTYGELPWAYNVDLHLEYPVRLGALSIVPIVDIFNLTNVQRVTAVDEVYNYLASGNQSPPYTNSPNPYFGKATAWQKPRLIRVGARISF